MATLSNEFSLIAVEKFRDGLHKMKCFEEKEVKFQSIDMWVTLVFYLDLLTGHITTDVRLDAGTKGELRYSFEFDQSFITELEDSISLLSY